MPFTFSHPSAALPLWPLVRRGYLPLVPLTIGAMAPDFEYLLRLEPYALLSHSAPGLVLFCLPLGLVAYVLWESLLRPVTRALFTLPPVPSAYPRTAGGWSLILAALLIGSATHIVWDAVTHRDTWGPVVFPVLRQTAFSVGGFDIPWYNVLQMASSLAGGAVVLAWLQREIVRHGEGLAALLAPWRQRGWIALAAAAVTVAAWNAPRHGLMTHITRTKLVLGRIAVGALVGITIGLVALALLHRLGRFRIAEPDEGRRHGTEETHA